MSGITIDLDIEGLELLADALQNAPEAVTRAAEAAGRRAVPILKRAIGKRTPVDTGWLKSNESVSMEGPFNILFADAVEYASYVNDYQQFVEHGTDDARPQVEAIYESAFDRLADSFGRGI